jgi:hypothetical protein
VSPKHAHSINVKHKTRIRQNPEVIDWQGLRALFHVAHGEACPKTTPLKLWLRPLSLAVSIILALLVKTPDLLARHSRRPGLSKHALLASDFDVEEHFDQSWPHQTDLTILHSGVSN